LCSRSSTRACRPTRFCAVIGVPERTWLRHQARARASRWQRGLWPRPARDRCVRRRGGMRWRIRRGDIGRCGQCAATTAWRCPRPACCACSEGKACCWRRTTSGNAASSRPGGRRRSRSNRPRRIRCGSWTSPSDRRPRCRQPVKAASVFPPTRSTRQGWEWPAPPGATPETAPRSARPTTRHPRTCASRRTVLAGLSPCGVPPVLAEHLQEDQI
jgi:hypothetical protein